MKNWIAHLLRLLVFGIPLFLVADPIDCYTDIATYKKQYTAHDIETVLSGFVKSNIYGDTRQTIDFGGGQFIWLPQPQILDANNGDINAHPDVGLSVVESRLRFDITAPQTRHCAMSGALEGDFWDIITIDETLNNAFAFQRWRMRHAYINLLWPHAQLLMGQYWHPMFVEECYPDVISFNAGSPFDPYSFVPQTRFTGLFGSAKTILTLWFEASEVTEGPQGPTYQYMHLGSMPGFNGQLQFLWQDHFCGVGADVKRIVPAIEEDRLSTHKVHESLVSAACMAYAAFNWDSCSLRTKLTYVQNGTDIGMLGGYGVTSIDQDTGASTYANINVLAWWVDFVPKTLGQWEPGLFLGVSKNLGAQQQIPFFGVPPSTQEQIIYPAPLNSLPSAQTVIIGDIDYAFRFSPRMRFKKFMPLEIAAEVECTCAAYGTTTLCAQVTNAVPVFNVRLLFSMYYFF